MDEHTYREEIDTNLKRPTKISWGAIFAGVVAMLGVSWLTYLLGLAIGVTAMDLSDSTLIGEGLSQGAILWMILTALVAYYVGAALAARLTGTADDGEGMMIGFTLWGAATTASVLLAYAGVSSMMQTGGSLVSAAASATGSAAQAVATTATSTATAAAGGAADAVAALEGTDVASTIRSRLKRQLAQSVAELDIEGGEDLSAEEIRESVESLDAAALDDLAAQLADDDQESAAELIASETELSQSEADELIDGAYKALEERFGDPDNDTGLAGDLRNQLAGKVAAAIVAMDPKGGTKVSEEAVEDALSNLDGQKLSDIAAALYNGETEEAKDLLVENTDLREKDVNELLEGATSAYEGRANSLYQTVEATADETTEAISTYASELLWAAFATTGLGLAAAVLGGWCGADTSRRLYYEVREVRND